MAWPTDDLSGEHADAGSDSPALFRPMMKKIVDYLKTIIGARGQADGVCDLDTNGKVPGWRTGRGEANGAAPLDANAKVASSHLPDATDTGTGAVRLATSAEVEGTGGSGAVTAGWLNQRTATTARAGLARFATAEEARAQERDDLAVSPAGLQTAGGGRLFTSTDGIELANGDTDIDLLAGLSGYAAVWLVLSIAPVGPRLVRDLDSSVTIYSKNFTSTHRDRSGRTTTRVLGTTTISVIKADERRLRFTLSKYSGDGATYKVYEILGIRI